MDMINVPKCVQYIKKHAGEEPGLDFKTQLIERAPAPSSLNGDTHHYAVSVYGLPADVYSLRGNW